MSEFCEVVGCNKPVKKGFEWKYRVCPEHLESFYGGGKMEFKEEK